MALNMDLVRKRRDEAKEELARRAANFYDFRDGRNILRFLPPWEGSDDFVRRVGKHWGIGPEGKTMVFCPQVCFDKPCPICAEIDRMWKHKPDDATKEWLKRISATPRFYANVVDLKDLSAGVQVAELPKTVYLELLNIMADEETGVGDITKPLDGRDIIIDKTGTGIGTRYAVRPKLEPSAVDKSFLENLPNLDKLIRDETYESIKLIWEGKEPAALPAPSAPPAGRIPVSAPAPSPVPEPEPVIDTKVIDGVHVSAPDAEPECFGQFDEDSPGCLDVCKVSAECEAKLLKAKRAKAKAVAAPAPTAAPVTSTTVSADDLLKEMEAAISR